MKQTRTPAILIFDGSCDFCTLCVEIVRRLDWRHSIQILPFQTPGLPEQHQLTVADCEQAVWFIMPDGRQYRAAKAISKALDQLIVFPYFSLVYALPFMGWLEERLYAFIARNRSKLPGLRPYCQRPEANCGAS